jgi:hypothetical protein
MSKSILALIIAATFPALPILSAPCPPEGDGKTAMEKAGNPFKNRATAPTKINKAITLEAMVKPGDDTKRFSNDDAASVTGYVAVVKPGGLESCECHDPNLLDTHIALVTDPKYYADGTKHVIVEVTWHFRKAIGSTTDLKVKFFHKRVTITGPMFADKIHAPNATNTNPSGKNNWRATIWEVHPIVKIELAK